MLYRWLGYQSSPKEGMQDNLLGCHHRAGGGDCIQQKESCDAQLQYVAASELAEVDPVDIDFLVLADHLHQGSQLSGMLLLNPQPALQ